MNEEQYLYLTTTGHISGNPHEIEIWYVPHDGCFYLISEKRERAHWVQNIQRNPAITFRVGTQRYTGMGRIVDDASEPDLAQAVQALMDEKYRWSSGLIVELCGE